MLNNLKSMGTLLLLVLLSACYMPATMDSGGGLALSAALPRSMVTGMGPDNEVWVVGFLVEESAEPLLINAVWTEDRYEAYYSTVPNPFTASDVAKAWRELAENGCVTFNGGTPWFQFPMNRVNPQNGYAFGDFVIEGVPADRTYLLYLRVYEDRIEGLSDLDQPTEARSALHYFDENRFTNYDLIPNGWYYLNSWQLNYYTDQYYTTQGGISVWNTPFQKIRVKPGETTTVRLLLTDT